MSLKSLINDPEFKQLSPEEQRQAVVSFEPEAGNLDDKDYSTFISSLQGEQSQPTFMSKFADKLASKLPSNLANNAVNVMREFSPFPTSTDEAFNAPVVSGNQQDVVTLPLRPLMGLEKYGSQIKNAALAPVERRMDALAASPLKLGMTKTAIAGTVANELFAKPILRMATPFTPSEFGALGSLAMGFNSMNPQREQIAPNMAKAYMENAVPSTPNEIRYAQARMGKDAADLVLERPDLGNNRAAIRENAVNKINEIEQQVKQRLRKAVKEGVASKPTVVNDEFSKMQGKLQEPFVLPSGEKIQRFSPDPEFPDRNYPIENPQDLNLMTPGKKFTKGNSRGLFNPIDPKEEATQLEYLKKNRESDVLAAREAFKKRMEDPEYGFGIKKEFAVNRDDISKAFDDAASQINKTGVEDEAVAMLDKLKANFEKSHPKFADIEYWNDIKRAFHKLIGNKGYIAQNPSAKVEALKMVTNSIKRAIERVAPEVKGLNQEQGALLEIRDALIHSSPKEVRDATLLGPLKERATIMGARALYNPLPKLGISRNPAMALPVLRRNLSDDENR